jgi:hypothetical protein
MFVKEKSIHVEATPEVVFDYVSDIRRHSEWASHKLTIRKTDDGHYESKSQVGPLEPRSVIRIETQDRPRRITYIADDEFSGQYRWHFDITPTATGSTIKYGLERLRAPLWVQLLQPWLMWPMDGRSGVVTGLANIKRALEAGTQASTASSAG